MISTASGTTPPTCSDKQCQSRDLPPGAVATCPHAVITDSFRHPIQAFTDVGQRPAIVMPLSAGDAVSASWQI